MNTTIAQNAITTTTVTAATKTGFACILMTSLFFLWWFSNNLNPVLIPHLKKAFTVTTTQSTLVDSAVYTFFLFALFVIARVILTTTYIEKQLATMTAGARRIPLASEAATVKTSSQSRYGCCQPESE
jgi:fucose permease